MKSLKRYKILVFRKTELGDLLVAQMESNWLPEDNDRFAWELGGDYLSITDMSNIPPPN
jgi:hypothetical protein